MTLEKYPQLKKEFERLARTRREEILNLITASDRDYEQLQKKRSDTSAALKRVLDKAGEGYLFEEYSDAVYETEIYELDTIYKQALIDAMSVLEEKGLI